MWSYSGEAETSTGPDHPEPTAFLSKHSKDLTFVLNHEYITAKALVTLRIVVPYKICK